MSSLYEPLDSKRNEIRCLLLLPGKADDPLCGNLVTVSLDSEHVPEYEALSYVWGRGDNLKSMTLNGKHTTITPNLEIALQHLRQQPQQDRSQAGRLLWVDAVCINQDDLTERESQVKLMRRVYQAASKVLIWLGAEADDSDIAMRSIERFDKEYWKTYEFLVQFMDILYRPWFTRIWVVQEFALGSMKSQLGCGQVWVEWISFMTAWIHFADDKLTMFEERFMKRCRDDIRETFRESWIERAPQMPISANLTSEELILRGLRTAFGDDCLLILNCSGVPELFADIKANPTVWRARQDVIKNCLEETPEAKLYAKRAELVKTVPLRYHEFLLNARGILLIRKESLPFEEILKGTMNLRSTDPRDKIYGMLGLVSEEARKCIPIDYNKAPEWTFVPTMEYIIKHEPNGLALLGLLWRTRHFKVSIPSWVADMTISANYSDEHNPVFLRGSCLDSPWNWKQDVTISEDHTTLSARGLNFGKITHIVSFVDGERPYYVSRFREVEALIEKFSPRNEPLWRTLVGIRNTDPELCKPFAQLFEVLMERADERGGAAQKMFHDCILPVVKKRKFFVTDMGFAGIATPSIREGDTIVLIPGMVRAAVLRDVVPADVGVIIKWTEEDLQFQRITAFAYVGCHDREGFERASEAKFDDWKQHVCFNREMETFHII